MLQGVKCAVSNCKYWKEYKCDASNIEVDIDGGVKNANMSEQTNCQTFEAK